MVLILLLSTELPIAAVVRQQLSCEMIETECDAQRCKGFRKTPQTSGVLMIETECVAVD